MNCASCVTDTSVNWLDSSRRGNSCAPAPNVTGATDSVISIERLGIEELAGKITAANDPHILRACGGGDRRKRLRDLSADERDVGASRPRRLREVTTTTGRAP